MATVGWMFFLAMMVFSIAAPIGGLLWWERRQAERHRVAGEVGHGAQSVGRARELGSAAKTTNQRIQAIRIAKAERDIPYLMDALTDPDVRTYAARYLADLGAGEAGPAIARLLGASDARARSAAIKALARLRLEGVTATLIELASSDESPVVRSHAVGALGRTGSDERIERALIDALSDPDPAVGWCAAHRLASIGGQMAIGPLLTAAERAHPLRRRAYRKAVRQIRTRSASARSR